jgi:hypothetical protein
VITGDVATFGQICRPSCTYAVVPLWSPGARRTATTSTKRSSPRHVHHHVPTRPPTLLGPLRPCPNPTRSPATSPQPSSATWRVGRQRQRPTRRPAGARAAMGGAGPGAVAFGPARGASVALQCVLVPTGRGRPLGSFGASHARLPPGCRRVGCTVSPAEARAESPRGIRLQRPERLARHGWLRFPDTAVPHPRATEGACRTKSAASCRIYAVGSASG